MTSSPWLKPAQPPRKSRVSRTSRSLPWQLGPTLCLFSQVFHNHFSSNLFLENGVFNWGRGDYGSFGNGYGGFFKAPAENKELSEFLEHNHLKVVQAKSSGYSTVLLLSKTNSYGFVRVFFIEATGNSMEWETTGTGNWESGKMWGSSWMRLSNNPLQWSRKTWKEEKSWTLTWVATRCWFSQVSIVSLNNFVLFSIKLLFIFY